MKIFWTFLWVCLAGLLLLLMFAHHHKLALQTKDEDLDSPKPTSAQDSSLTAVAAPSVKTNAVMATARGVSVVPGAIVCRDFDTVRLMFDLYADYWSDATQDSLTHGQSRVLRGAPASKPDFELHGCALLAPGTPMTLETGNIVPVVAAKLSDGRTIMGVTLGSMVFVSQEVQEEQRARQEQEKLLAQEEKRQRYVESLPPVEQQHAVALEQERQRDASVLESLYSSNQVPDRVALAEEDRRHDIAVRQENERYLSEKQAARKQTANSSQP
jgi:hypothetical protein